MTSTVLKTAAAFALVAGTFATTTFATVTDAEAALQTRPAVSVAGAPNINMARAQASARSKWSQQARARYGNQFANWSTARGRGMSCKKVTVVWSCRATANPAANIKVCKPNAIKVNSKSKISEADARQRAVRKWSKRAGRDYGATFASWGKASGRVLKCNLRSGAVHVCKATARACD